MLLLWIGNLHWSYTYNLSVRQTCLHSFSGAIGIAYKVDRTTFVCDNFLGIFFFKSLITCPLSMHFTKTFQYISRLSSTLSSLSFGTWKCKQLIDQNLTPVSSAVCLRVCVGMHHSSFFFNQLPYIPILNWICFIRIIHNLSSPYATMNWNAYSDSEIAFDIWS